MDVDVFRPEPREQALTRLLEKSRRDPPNPGNANERLPDEGNAERLAVFPRPGASTILYFGKLLRNKGVHLLLEALDGIDARAVIVGSAITAPSWRPWPARMSSSPARSSTATSST